MKKIVFLLTLISIQPSAFAKRAITPMKAEECLTEQGQPKPSRHCVCFTAKTVCADGKGTCAQRQCEEWTCADDKDCSQISAKCIEKFCKLL
jgi:hypothetical protein